MIREILDITEKLLLVFIAIFLVFIILLKLNVWLSDTRGYMLSAGNLEFALYLTLLGFMIAYVMKRLIVWEIHLTLGDAKKKLRFRRR